MDLTPDTLRTFTAAAQTRNFTQAALKVNLTQSAVSHQIRKLEERLGVTLFERVPHGVILTAEGESLQKYANRLLELHNEALASFSQSDMNGLIRLGATEEYAALYLPGILKRFSEKHPFVRVDLYCERSEKLRRMQEKGRIDLCLRNTEVLESDAFFLREEALVWAGPKDAEPELKRPLAIAVYNEGCIHRRCAIKALERENIDYRIAYSSPSIAGILAAVRSGLAVAPIGISTCTSDLSLIAQNRLPALPPSKICLFHSDKHMDQARTALAEHIMDEFSEFPVPAEP